MIKLDEHKRAACVLLLCTYFLQNTEKTKNRADFLMLHTLFYLRWCDIGEAALQEYR